MSLNFSGHQVCLVWILDHYLRFFNVRDRTWSASLQCNERILMTFYGRVESGPRTNHLYFGGDLVWDPDSGHTESRIFVKYFWMTLVKGIARHREHCWTGFIRQVLGGCLRSLIASNMFQNLSWDSHLCLIIHGLNVLIHLKTFSYHFHLIFILLLLFKIWKLSVTSHADCKSNSVDR